MATVSDYKSSPFDVYVQPATPSNYVSTATPQGPGYIGTGLNGIPDYSYDSLCGVKFNLDDGRQVVLARNGTTAIAIGLLAQAPAEITAFNNLAITVPSAYPATAGTKQILVTNGSTVLNQNQFAGGYLITNDDTGEGQTLRIASHGGGSNAGTFVVTLQDPIQITLDATTNVTLVPNPYIGTVVGATGLTGVTVGATFYTFAASTASTYSGTTGALQTTGIPSYGFLGCSGILVSSV